MLHYPDPHTPLTYPRAIRLAMDTAKNKAAVLFLNSSSSSEPWCFRMRRLRPLSIQALQEGLSRGRAWSPRVTEPGSSSPSAPSQSYWSHGLPFPPYLTPHIWPDDYIHYCNSNFLGRCKHSVSWVGNRLQCTCLSKLTMSVHFTM